jgi:hypothetical protein
MSAKSAGLLLLLLFSWAAVGGCPTTTGVDDGIGSPDNAAPADSGSDATDGSQDGGGASDGQANGSADAVGDDDCADDGDSGGDDDSAGDGDSGGGPPIFTGSYSGQWARVGQESLGGTPGSEEEWTTDQTITFGADGIPTAFIVPGYLQTQGGIDFVAEVKQVGDTVTLNESAGGLNYTLTVTVALADYAETTARVVLNLVHHAEDTNPALTQDGTGVQVVQYSLQGGQLEYSSTTAYEVTWFYGSIDTTWDVSCDGTLTPD